MKRSVLSHLLLAPDSTAGAATALAAPPASSGGEPASTPAIGAPANIDNPTKSSANMFDELDAMATPAKPKADAAKPPEKPVDEPKNPAEAPIEEPKDKGESDLNTPKGLRNHVKKVESEHKAAREQIRQLEQKIAESEARGKDTTTLTERLASVEKEREQLRGEIRALKQEASPEFQEKYEKPWKEAAEYARQIVIGLEAVKTDEDGNVTETRAASWDTDFAPIYELSRKSMSAAIKQAKAVFGDGAQTVIAQVQELHRREYQRNVALQEERTNFKQKQEAEIAEQSKMREWADKSWRDVNTDLAEKNAEYFQPDPKDKQRAEIFTKSLNLIDSRHNSNALTPIQRITLDAHARLRAAAYPVLQYDLAKKAERIAELEEQLAGKQDGEPGATQRASTGSPSGTKEISFMEEMGKLE